MSERVFNLSPPGLFALLFTDAGGQVVFTDSNFLRMSQRDIKRPILGSPLQQVLDIEDEASAWLMEKISSHRQPIQSRLDLSGITGGRVPAVCTAVATLDERGAFIGADIALHDARFAPAEPLPTEHADVLGIYLEQSLSDVHTRQNRSYLQAYFATQIDALQILLGRMGGTEVRANLEARFNRTARQSGWQIIMTQGQIDFGRTSIGFNAYGTLLREAVDYAIRVVGQRMVIRELRIIESRADQQTLDLADRIGLRLSFDDCTLTDSG